MYSLKVLVLDGCPYCDNLIKLLDSNNIKTKYIVIPWNEKDKYKNSSIDTFPQVYMVKDIDDTGVLIGGYSDVKNIIDLIEGRDLDSIKKIISSKYSILSNKKQLRLIKVFTKT